MKTLLQNMIEEQKTETLKAKIGQVVHWGGNMGFREQDFIIISKTVNTWGTLLKMVSLEDMRYHHTQENHLILEGTKTRHGQNMYLTKIIYTPVIVEKYMKEAFKKKANDDKIKEEKKQTRQTLVDNLPKKYPHLKPFKDTKKSSYACGAGNIRVELKKAFPGIKFSVRSEGYAGGSSINIRWIDGPITTDVEKITKKYEQGHFDGMDDSYKYNNNPFSDVFGNAKYVFQNRSYSETALNKASSDLGYAYKYNSNTGDYDGATYEENRFIKEKLYETAFDE